MVAFHYAARSDIGLGRYKNNQDSGYAGTNLLVVADGMGGYAGGDVASSLAIGNLIGLDADAPGADALQELERCIHNAATEIRDRVVEEPDLRGMGTTVTAILRHGNRLALAHIGDSRAYLLRDGELTQVTADHTFVQRLVDEGQITSEEADRHPQRNIVLRVIGDVDAPEDVDSSVREAHLGDRWMLCSDGLSGFVSRETLAETLAGVPDPGAAADQLIQLALRAGGADNITCVVADIVSEDEHPDVQPQVVGAAATDRAKPTAAPADSAAAKAAALTRAAATGVEEAEYTEDDEPSLEPGRPGLRGALAALLVLALVAAGLYGAWVWSQRQYYVAAADGKVAIFRGLSGDIGPLQMSAIVDVAENLPVDTLDTTNQKRVAAGIGADDLADARRIVVNLYAASSVCDTTVITTPSSSPSQPVNASPTTPAPTQTTGAATPSPTGSPGQTSNPSTDTAPVTPLPSTRPVPVECPEN